MNFRLIIFIGLISSLGFAQQQKQAVNYKDKPLSDVLLALEKQFGVTFSYNATELAKQKITLKLKTYDLQRVVSVIEANYPITFNKIDDVYYSVVLRTTISICGYLKDALEGNPIADASIVSLQKGTGTTSDATGYFELTNIKTTDTLSVSYLGFKTFQIPSVSTANKHCATFTMLSENFSLNEVVIQDYLSSGVVKLEDGAIKVVPNNLNVLAGQAEPDVLQTVQLLPGVESPNENATGLHVRGGSPDQNLILWDGIKMYNTDHFFGMLSSFNPNITEGVRFYRSGANPIYGDRISGIIDISSKTKIPNKLKGGLGVNTTHTDAYLHIPITKQTAVLVSARRSLTDVITTPAISNFANSVFQNTNLTRNLDLVDANVLEEDGRFYFTDATFKLQSNLSEKDVLTTSAIYTKNSLNYSLNGIEINESSQDNLLIKNYGANVVWNRKWNEKLVSIAALYFSNYDLSYSGVNRINDNKFNTQKSNTIKEYGLKFHTTYQLNANFSLINGYNYFDNEVAYLLQNSSSSEEDNRNNPTHSFYTGFNYRKLDQWHIDVGLRTEYYTILNRMFFEPRIAIEHTINDNIRLNFTAELRNQAISQILEFTSQDFGLENQVWALVDDEDNLLLQSDQLSLGVSYNRNGWTFDADMYYKNIFGFTSLTKSFAPSEEGIGFSEGNSTVFGLDILLKKRFNNYATWLGYTRSYNRYEFDYLSEGFSFRANNNSKHSFIWSHAYTTNNFQFSLGWKFRTGVPFTQALGIGGSQDAAFIIYDEVNGATLPNYHRLDVSAVYTFNWFNNVKAKLGVALLNLYNKKNILNRNFSLTEELNDQNVITFSLQANDRTSLRFTPNLFLRIDF